MSGKGFLGNMTENLHADCVQSRQAGFVRCYLNTYQYYFIIARFFRLVKRFPEFFRAECFT